MSPIFEDVSGICLVKLSSIGDVVHALPVAAALRRKFPGAYIAWAVQPAAADIVVGNPHLDETLVVGGSGATGPGVRHLPGLSSPQRLARALRAHRFDLALDMQGLLKSAWTSFLSGARHRIGYRRAGEGAFLLYTHRLVSNRADAHAVDIYLEFAKLLGAPTDPLDFTIAVSEEDRRAVDDLLGPGDNLVALVPGARWLSKRWPAARFAELADLLAEGFGCTIVLVGDARDAPLSRQIGALARTHVLDLTGRTTLKQLAETLRRCHATISNDTGPMHISAALATPTVGIFGPTNPVRVRPYGEGHITVTPSVSCHPCRRRECSPLKCMESITTEEVFAAARRLLERRRGGDSSAIE